MACELGASVIRTHNVALTAQALEENLRPYVLIGMGCNVALVADEGEEREGKIAMINKAIGDMCMLPDTQIIDISSYYESEPAYFEDQDLFVNTVVLMRTGLPRKNCHLPRDRETAESCARRRTARARAISISSTIKATFPILRCSPCRIRSCSSAISW